MVAWPSGLRRWFKAPVSSEARVRISPLPKHLFYFVYFVYCSLLSNANMFTFMHKIDSFTVSVIYSNIKVSKCREWPACWPSRLANFYRRTVPWWMRIAAESLRPCSLVMAFNPIAGRKDTPAGHPNRDWKRLLRYGNLISNNSTSVRRLLHKYISL